MHLAKSKRLNTVLFQRSMWSEASLQDLDGMSHQILPNSFLKSPQSEGKKKNSNGSAKGHGEVFMTSVCNRDFSLKSTESEGG